MEQIPLSTLKSASSILTWLAFWLAVAAAVTGWLAAQVRSETGRRSDLRVATAEENTALAASAAAAANARAEAIKAENLRTEERVIGAERALEAERTERLKLEKRLAPRKITPAQAKGLRDKLTPHARARGSEITISVFATTGTAEAQLFAISLSEALEGCGFEIHPANVDYGISYMPRGVAVLSSDDPDGLARGRIVTEALVDIGVTAHLLPSRKAFSFPHGIVVDGTYLYNQGLSILVGDQMV